MIIVFVAKLVLVPALIAAITVAGTRFGPRIAGMLTGLPVVAGPIAFVMALDQGAPFAARSAAATLAGEASLACFCILYAWMAERAPWWASVAIGWLGFLAGTVALDRVAPSLPVALAIALVMPVVMRATIPRPPCNLDLSLPLGLELSPMLGANDVGVGRVEIVLRMLAGIALMLALTGVAEALGPRLSGLLTVFPIATTVLAVFSHRNQGAAFAARLLRGLALGLYSLTAFFTTLAFGLEPWGVAPAFLVAVAAALGAQVVVLALQSQA